MKDLIAVSRAFRVAGWLPRVLSRPKFPAGNQLIST